MKSKQSLREQVNDSSTVSKSGPHSPEDWEPLDLMSLRDINGVPPVTGQKHIGADPTGLWLLHQPARRPV